MENRKQKTAEYRITLLRDYDAGGAFTLPKTGTYASLVLTGTAFTDAEGISRYPALTFTGSLTLTGNVTIEKLKKLCSVKKAGTDLTADFNISMGNYRLELKDIAESSLKNISGSAKSTLILHGISVKGTITAGNLFMENVTAGGNVRAMGEYLTVGEIKIPGTFTAEGLQKSYAQTVLNVRQGKKITIGKKGILPCNPQIFFTEQTAPAAEYSIGIRMENKKGELLTFTAADRNSAVADIAGGFANGDVYLAGQTNTLLVRSGNKLVYSGSTEGPAATGASWEIVSPESNITVKDFAGGNVSVGYSVKKNLKFTGKVTGTGCITLIPMKTTPDKYHIIATLTRNEKVVTQVSSYYDISCFKLLDSVNVPAGSSLKKKGTTVILEMP